MKLITIYGLRRSGNHAIANWIMSHYPAGCYLNDTYNKIRTKSDWLPCYRNNCKQTDLENHPNIIIIGIENRLDKRIHKTYLQYLKSYYKLQYDINELEILLIRNIANLVASHLKAWGEETYHEKISDEWKNHFDFCINNNIQQIVYDKWLDISYRNSIASTIGFINNDLGIEQIPHYGGGSSFKDKKVNRDNLKNRWKTMLNNDRYLNIMKNFKYWNEYQEIFGQDEIYKYFNF
jgi:hypothetical protein